MSLLRHRQRHEAEALLAEHAAAAEVHGEYLITMMNHGVRAIIAADELRHDDAERLAAIAEEIAGRHSLREHSAAWAYHMARGLSWLRSGDHARASQPLRRARQLVRRAPLALETIEVLTASAIVEQRLGSVDLSTRHLGEAHQILMRCIDPGYLVADPRTLTVSRGSGRGARPPADLSYREAEVLGLVGEGLTTEAVAERLGLSPRTVHAHLRSIYRKINVGARGAAVRWAIGHGLARPPSADLPKAAPPEG
jgi:DNA-binding CsgD family transcriptional regulator